jgi:hypothetical protein
MKLNYYQLFRERLFEEEMRASVENESTMEKILRKSKKLTSVLTELLTSQPTYNDKAKDEIREIVSDIRVVSFKPTTFRIVIKNGNFFELKYDPTPLELDYPEDFKPKDAFVVLVSGKKYSLTNKSELEQALDYINNLLKTSPLAKESEPIEEPTDEAPPEDETPGEPDSTEDTGDDKEPKK